MDHPDDDALSLTAKLVGRLQTNPHDREAWRQLIERYTDRVSCWSKSLGLQQADGDDLWQEVLSVLCGKDGLGKFVQKHGLKTRGRFQAWLRTVFHNKCQDLRRRNRRKPGDTGRGDPDIEVRLQQWPDRLVEGLWEPLWRDLALKEACEKLREKSPKQWNCLMARRENLTATIEELATGSGITEGAFQMNYLRALQFLKNYIQEFKLRLEEDT